MARKLFRDEGYYSPAVQEIMGTVPSWITRWGISVIAIMLAMVLAGCYFVRYPETIDKPVAIVKAEGDSLSYIGILHLSSSDIAEVREGQQVSIKLKSHPYEKDGLLRGVVDAISDTLSLTGGETMSYRAEVRLPNGLTSTYGKSLKYFENMDGDAKIVVRNRRLIEHIFKPLSSSTGD